MNSVLAISQDAFNWISLLVGIAGVIVGFVSVIMAKKEKKAKIKQEIAAKQAEIDSIKVYYGFDNSGKGNNMVKRIKLERDIEELKKKL